MTWVRVTAPTAKARAGTYRDGMSRVTAATQLAVQAEFAGWELSRVRVYADGTRTVWLRRRRTAAALPGLSV